VDFVLRIDTDALVIGPFARDVTLFLEHNPDTGVVGTLGKSNNPEVRARPRRDVVPRLLRARTLWPVASEAPEADDNESRELGTFGPVSLYQRRQFDRIRPHLDDAMANGYAKHEYCQGGVLAIGRMMVRRMSAAGYLSQADAWRGLPFPDDYVLAMYSRGVGLNIADFSGPGEPFGSQSTGLPFPMEELVARGHSLIHSVRHDKRADERTIRRYFSERAPRAGR
jgi:hypothetical protein